MFLPGLSSHPAQTAVDVLPVVRRSPFGLQVGEVRGNVFANGRVLVVGYRVFGHSDYLCLDQFRPAFQVGQHRPGGTFVPAAGRQFPDDTRAVPILRGVGPRRYDDAVGAVLPGGHGGRSALLFGVEPFGKPLPLANDDLRPGRQRLGCGLAVDGAHISSPFGFWSLPAWSLRRPLDNRDFLRGQAVQVIHQPVNLRVRRVNLTLDNGLLRDRFRGGKVLLHGQHGVNQADYTVVPFPICRI